MSKRDLALISSGVGVSLVVLGIYLFYSSWEDKTRFERHKLYIERMHAEKADLMHPKAVGQ